jgi:hypothetical protein
MLDLRAKIWDALTDLDSETLLNVLTGYHGTRLLDEGFAEYLVGEGIMESDEDGDGDEEPIKPEDDDYVMSDCGLLGSMIGVSVQSGWANKDKYKRFDTETEAVAAIREDMKAQQFWSDVWRVDDRGGIERYDTENWREAWQR